MGLFDLFKAPRPAVTANAGADAQAQANALVDEGNGLCDQGRLPEALERYAKAIALAPGLARAHLNAGNALLAMDRTEAALEAYSAALLHRPGYAAAHYNIGNAQLRRGDPDAAMAAYRSALEADPHFADAWVALGNVQDDLCLRTDAIASYEQALRLQPRYAQVHANLGNALRQGARWEDAADAFRRALQLEPSLAQAHAGLGTVLQERGDAEAALACFRRAAVAPDADGSALALAYHCANLLCDWSRRREDEAALERAAADGSAVLAPFFLLSLDPRSYGPAQLQLEAARRFAHKMVGVHPAQAQAPRATGIPQQQRLRIGYLSADFHDHATMHLLGGVLAAHDRERFEITAYSYGATDDDTTGEVRRTCEGFRDLRALSDAQAAQLIAADGIDILVDLKGFTRNTRLGISARRPAPVVVSWLGYPGTLGEPRLADYIVGDPVVTPPEHSGHFSETLALMPHCYQPNNDRKAMHARPSRAQAGLPEDAFVFCSFNQNYKFGPGTFDTWCRLMTDVPGSVLWLLPSSGAAAANLRREAAARGIAAERLVFSATLPLADHLARLALADLALDTYPCNSHTTGSDALWAGVPLVTRMGETFASRVAASLVTAAGAPGLVTHSWDEYLALARALALDPPRLAALREQLAAARAHCPLFDTPRFTRDLERLYGRMWGQHLSGERQLIALPPQDSVRG